MPNNVYASAQSNLDARAQNTSRAEKIGAISGGLTDVVDAYRRSQKFKRVSEALQSAKGLYDPNSAGFGSLPPEAQFGAQQKSQELELLGAGLDSTNIDAFADLYSKFTAKSPDVSKLIGDRKVAEIRASAMAQVANARAKAAIKLQRDKLNYGASGDSSGLGDGDPLADFDSDMQAGYGADQAIFGGE